MTQPNPFFGCEGKFRFATMGAATKASKKLSGRSGAYRCKHCHGYHAGAFMGGGKLNKRPRYVPRDEEEMA